jgi:hypothetical protein
VETGVSDPTPPARLPYPRLLQGLAEIHPATLEPPMAPAPPAVPARGPAPAPTAFTPVPKTLLRLDPFGAGCVLKLADRQPALERGEVGGVHVEGGDLEVAGGLEGVAGVVEAGACFPDLVRAFFDGFFRMSGRAG